MLSRANAGQHDYEFGACKVIEKEKMDEKELQLLENEIVN